MQPVDLASKFALIDERWRPKVAARLNGQEVKLVKVKGVFPWHTHDAVDEMLLVHRGRFRVEFRDGVADMGLRARRRRQHRRRAGRGLHRPQRRGRLTARPSEGTASGGGDRRRRRRSRHRKDT